MTKYDKFEDNTGIKVNTNEETLKIACCDCGLVHYIGITILDEKNVLVGFKRDKRATSQLRRCDYGNLQKPAPNDKYAVVRRHECK